MFTTYMLVCSMVVQDSCIELKDNRGPYETHNECVLRAEEMSRDIQSLLYVPHSFAYKCLTEEPDELQV